MNKTSKSFKDLLNKIKRDKVKSRLKAAFKRKKRPSKVRIPDDNEVATKH